MNNYLHIFTDGSSRGNPGPGGWGFVMVINKDPKEAVEGDFILNYGSGFNKYTTNNAMELEAIKKSITTVVRARESGNINYLTPSKVILHSDSSYCINTLTKWIYGWKSKGILNQKKNWQIIDTIDVYRNKLGKKLEFNKVPGHSGNFFNELADNLATGTLKRIPFGFDIYETNYYKLEQWK